MAIDYSKIPLNDLQALKKNDLKNVSSETLNLILQDQNQDRDLSVTEEIKDTGQSKVNPLQRLMLSFADKQGSQDYLKGKGMDPVYRSGQQYLKGNNGSLEPVDPAFNFKDYLKTVGPSLAFPPLGMAITKFGIPGVMSGAKPGAIKEQFSDLLELAPDAVSGATQTVGSLLGGLAGGATGGVPGGIAGAYAGGIGGAGAGEKVKQLIGRTLGVRGKSDIFDPETNSAMLTAAVTELLPAATQTAKSGLKSLGILGKERQIPERLYAWSTGMQKELKSDKGRSIIRDLMDEGYFGKSKTLIEKSSGQRDNLISELEGLLSKGEDIKISDVEQTLKNNKYLNKLTSSDQDEVKKEIYKNLKSIKNRYAPDSFDLVTGTKINDTIPIEVMQKEKKALWEKVGDLFSGDSKTTTSKKVSMALGSSIKDAIEQASKHPERVAELNQKIYKYGLLAENLGVKLDADLAKESISTTDAILAGLSAKALATKTSKNILKSTWAGTNSAKKIDELIKIMSKSNLNRTVPQSLTSSMATDVINNLKRNETKQEE